MVAGVCHYNEPHRPRSWSHDFEEGVLRDDELVMQHLAAAWLEDAAMEHASVAAFSRAALQLMALGAPAELVAGCHQAALDEIEHARLCYGLASAHAAVEYGPDVLCGDGVVTAAPDLLALALETFVDGCVGETVAAVHARHAADGCHDKLVHDVLMQIASDEERHAELAWRIVAWSVRVGGAAIADAIARTARSLPEQLMHHAQVSSAEAKPSLVAQRLRAHGRLDAQSEWATTKRAIEAIVKPCVQALCRGPAVSGADEAQAAAGPSAAGLPA